MQSIGEGINRCNLFGKITAGCIDVLCQQKFIVCQISIGKNEEHNADRG